MQGFLKQVFKRKRKMKNTGFDAWKARLEYMNKEFPFTRMDEGIIKIVNEEGRLHADYVPAWRSPTRIMWYRDGRKHGIDADIYGSITYYFENIRIPSKYYQAMSNPDLLTVEEVLGHTNQEVRYVGMKIVGFDRIMKSKKTKIIHRDTSKGQMLFTISGIFDEPVAYVKVINSTAEPDGSFKNYFLCVPPEMTNCREAVAWTFRMTADEYMPSQET
jgi:hypothetical protein